MILKFLLIFSLFLRSSAEIEIPERRNLSEMAIGEGKIGFIQGIRFCSIEFVSILSCQFSFNIERNLKYFFIVNLKKLRSRDDSV